MTKGLVDNKALFIVLYPHGRRGLMFNITPMML